MINYFINFMEQGRIPDPAIRFGIRKLCQTRLKELTTYSLEEKEKRAQSYRRTLTQSPLAVHTKEANEQHYELPSDFFQYALGKNLKYSSCYWDQNTNNLDQAEDLALKLTMEHADLKDGMKILELGCGWGSLTLKMAATFPHADITAVSNSASQKAFIEKLAKQRGLNNVTILTRDLSKVENLELSFETYDRVVSVEMFEHFKNYEILLERISKVLKPEGKLFVHVFSHKEYSYPFETEGDDNWMGKYFFTGGQMPAHHLLPSFQKHMALEQSWAWDGTHYGKTSNAWLENMDKNKSTIMEILKSTYGAEATVWFNRWRVFFMSCAELFNYQGGQEWGVSHYLFQKK